MTDRFARRTNWKLTTNAYTRALAEYRESGSELLDLTASNPTTIGLQYDNDKLLAALAKPEALVYEPTPKGLLSARKAIAGYYAERGVQISADQLILTTSTSEAYSFVFRLLCDPGDTILVPMPSYPLFDFLADIQDAKLMPYELVYDHGWQLDFPSLEQGLSAHNELGKCKAVLVVHPNNPTGSLCKPNEMAELADFCSRNHLAIIADEVFLDYSLNEAAKPSFAHVAHSSRPGFGREGGNEPLTFTLSGLSKISGLPQMKVAWIVTSGPDELRAEALNRLEVIADTYLSMNAPIQWAIPAMLQERHSMQQQLMTRIRANLAELDRQLAAQKLCTRLEVEGGWYVVLCVPVTASDEETSIALLQSTGVLVQPGHFYDFASDGYLVVSLITPAEIFATGIKRLLRFIV